MDSQGTGQQVASSHPLFTLGSGWMVPSVLVAFAVALVYLPTHGAAGVGVDGLIAAVGVLYAIAVSVVAPRVIRGSILRIGGSRHSIVLLGLGGDALETDSVRARWRLLAVACSFAASATVAIIAFSLAGTVAPGSYAHAVASLAAVANGVLAGALLVPVPGTQGWAAALALADAIGAGPKRRIRYAVGLARIVGVAAALVMTVIVVASGHLMLLVLVPWLAFIVYGQTRDLVARDAEIRYLSARRAGDLSRPILAVAQPEEPVEGLVWDGALPETVWLVGHPGAFVGAIGPRQRSVAPALRRTSADAMVPIEALRPLPASSPATDLVPTLVRHGFALVAGEAGLGYVEERDLARRIRIWEAFIDRIESPAGRPPADAPSEPGAGS